MRDHTQCLTWVLGIQKSVPHACTARPFTHCVVSPESPRNRHFKAQDFNFFILYASTFPRWFSVISLLDTQTDRLSNFLVSFGFKYYELALVPSVERTHFPCRREISSICKEQSPSFITSNRRFLRARGNYPGNVVLWSPAPSRSLFKIQSSESQNHSVCGEQTISLNALFHMDIL